MKEGTPRELDAYVAVMRSKAQRDGAEAASVAELAQKLSRITLEHPGDSAKKITTAIEAYETDRDNDTNIIEGLHGIESLPQYLRIYPEALLPQTAQVEIETAQLRQKAMRDFAIASINARLESLEKEWTPEERELWSVSLRDRAICVLSARLRAYIRIGFREAQLELLMRASVESATNALELSSFEQEAVRSKLIEERWLLENPNPGAKTAAAELAPLPATAPDPAAPRAKTIENYDRFFLTPESREFACERTIRHYRLSSVKEIALKAGRQFGPKGNGIDYSTFRQWVREGKTGRSKNEPQRRDKLRTALESYIGPAMIAYQALSESQQIDEAEVIDEFLKKRKESTRARFAPKTPI